MGITFGIAALVFAALAGLANNDCDPRTATGYTVFALAFLAASVAVLLGAHP